MEGGQARLLAITATQGTITTEIDLSWSKSEGVVSYYQIEDYSDADPEGDWQLFGSTNSSEALAFDYPGTVVAGGNSYSFRVMAVSGGGQSAYSDPTEPIQTFEHRAGDHQHLRRRGRRDRHQRHAFGRG